MSTTSIFIRGPRILAAGVLIAGLVIARTTGAETPPPALSQSMAAAAVAAYHHSPAIKAARQSLRGVQELYPQALAQYQPQVNFSAGLTDERLDNSNFAGADGATTKDAGITLDQPLYRGGRSRAQKNEAKARINAQQAIVHATEQRVMADAMQAVIDQAAATETLQVLMRAESLYQQLQGDTQLRRDGGEATDTDLALADTRISGVSADRLAAENSLQEARLALEALTGTPVTAPLPQGQALTVALPATPDEALALARRHNADRQALVAVVDADNHGIELTTGELLPQLRFLAGWTREWDPAPGLIDEATSRRAGLRLTVPLYEGGGTRARVRQARHRMAESQHAVADYDLALQQDIRTAWSARTAAIARVDALQAQAAAADRARVNIDKEVAGGEKTMTDLLQADQIWLDAQMAAISARQAAWAAEVDLLRLTGLLTPAALGVIGPDDGAYVDAVRWRTLSTAIPD